VGTPSTPPVGAPGIVGATQPVLDPGGPTLRRININTATRAELELLPGIGPAVAQRIIDHRAAHGRFASAADLDNVKGIGPKTLEKLKDLVRVE
jgi:competence protein ComEA